MSKNKAADVIRRLLATSSDPNKGRRRKRSSRQSSDEEISEGEMTDRSDEQDDDDDEDDEGPVDEFDAEFFGDSKDRAELMAMSEVDREQILFERAKKREVLLDHRQVAKRLKRQEEANRSSRKGSGSTRDSARRSTRAKDSKTGSTKALADLKKAQERKRARRSNSPEPKRRRKGSIDYSDKSESASSEEEPDYDSEPEKKKSSKSIARKPATLEDLNSIRISRDRVEKWCYNPYFRNTVIGCFARLSIGEGSRRAYRITEIVAVNKQSKIYAVGNTMTNLTLTLKHGGAEKTFTMDYLSNSPFTDDEFRRYEIQQRNDKVDIVTLDHVENKRKDLEQAKEYVLSAKEVEAIIELKKEMKQGRLNPIVHRTILEQQKMTQSLEEAEETERRLKALRESELAQRDMRSDKLDVWAKLNERNRNLNRTSGRQAEQTHALEKRLKGAAGKDGIDPFARRKTIPRLIYDDISASNPATPTANGNVDSGASSPSLTAANSPAVMTPVATPTVQTVSATPAMPQSRLEELIAANKDDFDIEIDMDDI
ncbi:RNA polymerase-associated protein rtf1 [Mortierella alpina]|nr:RNA polymerase-associated protein rtf1 [Mortierella alpina]